MLGGRGEGVHLYGFEDFNMKSEARIGEGGRWGDRGRGRGRKMQAGGKGGGTRGQGPRSGRANMAHGRQSAPDYGLGFQEKVVKTFNLGIKAGKHAWGPRKGVHQGEQLRKISASLRRLPHPHDLSTAGASVNHGTMRQPEGPKTPEWPSICGGRRSAEDGVLGPLSSELGKYKTVQPSFWSRLSDKSR